MPPHLDHRLPAASPLPSPSPASAAGRRAFTLIEMMIVVAVVVILASIAMVVGVQVKTNAAKKYTQTTLITLRDAMKDYLAAGNAEPGFAPLIPSDPGIAAVTSPPSDAINWVMVLRASPVSANKLSSLRTANIFDNNGNLKDAANQKYYLTIIDGFGTPIRYVPFDTATKRDGYFQSFGADHVPSNPNPAVTPAPPQDDVFSTDAF